jgi:predicted transposase YbfD/YdcC
MTAKRCVSIVEYFGSLPDPRMDRTRRHELLDIIVIALCAVICSAETWEDVETFGRAKHDWFKRSLKLPNGIPSHDTFNRVFALLDPLAFQECFLGWMRAVSEEVGIEQIAIDGKTLRHSFDRAGAKNALHLVSAWATANHVTLGQVAVADKSNEITAIPKLLELLDVSGAIVTIDAMGCQKDIADKIRDGGGDYVLAVKDNQGRLYEDILGCFERHVDGQEVGSRHDESHTAESGHGRSEKRTCFVIHDPDGIRDLKLWRDLKAICMVVSERTVAGETSVEARHYIGSRAGTAEEYSHWIRGHWGIENSLHWVLDVSFAEDDSRLRTGHGPENLALLRRIAISLLKNDRDSKHSIHTKRLQAGWDESYLLKVLCGFSRK